MSYRTRRNTKPQPRGVYRMLLETLATTPPRVVLIRYTRTQLESLLDDAEEQGDASVVRMIESELDRRAGARRNPRKARSNGSGNNAKHSSAFHRWFGDSKVVNADGTPKVVYHGTENGDFTSFRLDQIDAHHPGFFFTDNADVAWTYSGSSDLDPFVTHKKAGNYRLYLRITKPYVFDAKGTSWDNIPVYGPLRSPEFRAKMGASPQPEYVDASYIGRWAKSKGYDGAIIRNLLDIGPHATQEDVDLPATVYIVFDPKNIKSAEHNRGTWDATDADIRHNPRAKKVEEPEKPQRRWWRIEIRDRASGYVATGVDRDADGRDIGEGAYPSEAAAEAAAEAFAQTKGPKWREKYSTRVFSFKPLLTDRLSRLTGAASDVSPSQKKYAVFEQTSYGSFLFRGWYPTLKRAEIVAKGLLSDSTPKRVGSKSPAAAPEQPRSVVYIRTPEEMKAQYEREQADASLAPLYRLPERAAQMMSLSGVAMRPNPDKRRARRNSGRYRFPNILP